MIFLKSFYTRREKHSSNIFFKSIQNANQMRQIFTEQPMLEVKFAIKKYKMIIYPQLTITTHQHKCLLGHLKLQCNNIIFVIALHFAINSWHYIALHMHILYYFISVYLQLMQSTKKADAVIPLMKSNIQTVLLRKWCNFCCST